MQDITERLTAVLALDPAARALGTSDGGWFTYGDLSAAVRSLDRVLTGAGIGRGAPVAVLLRNRPAHFAVTLGLLMTRRCLVTVNPSLPDEPLNADLTAIMAAAVVADDQDWARLGVKHAVAAKGALGVRISSAPGGIELGKCSDFSPAIQAAPDESMQAIAVEMLTSGTTGKPKRIKLAFDSLSRSLWTGSVYEAGAGGQLALKRSVGIQWMPLAHIGGLYGAVYATYNARSFVLMERFNVDEWHSLILKHRPKFVNLPPSALHMVLERNYPKEDFSSLLALRSGAAPLNHDQAVEFERRYGVPVLEGYGATEFAGGVAGWTIRDHRKYSATKRASVGRANAGVELRVVDRQNFKPLEPNQEGLLEVRAGQIDGGRAWVRTADLARIDEDGFLFILGRADSAIIRGGFKIMPDKVEEALLSCAQVREACVVGIADDRLGQVPVAAVVAAEGVRLDEDMLRMHLRDRIKPYEIPVAFRVVAALPRTPSLKVSQVAVREMFQAIGTK